MHGLLRLVACLALTACADRTPPEDDSDSDGSTAPPVGTTAAPDDPTGDDSASGDTASGDSTAGDTGGGVPGVHAGACKPVEGNTCPMGHTCCSDDPATIQGLLPNYFDPGTIDDEIGTPLFSADNNDFSDWGFCIETGGFPSPLSNGCPVPCDPRWTLEQRVDICGGSQCCPFTAVDPGKDCILDPDTGRWRTVNGGDILLKRTEWGDAHATNQDPQLESCKLLAGGDQNALTDCVRQLGVADRRGYCFSGECPCVEDLCDQKNPDWVPRCP
ncbi:hypothetical protein SAMN02745121_03502 [Nannocystis exedens]|uniref:Uncharacterized protein n=1 Tax=Nannocystis exedens TaxID=54 RepID=A0A1I1YS60_9BACT|nr:hypothetical protein [Nannocystis exedens]PCC70177.1 hypothetical protein NAEX_03210 [Nannocystis exedens]SFE22311.1 hypothetical protein SAMN02745121_03502 [Nannocystis exedens]